jgi:hypothetical protein
MDELRASEESSPSPICAAFVLKLGRTPDKAKRQRILAACVKVRRPWAEELLWEALADPNEGVRSFVVMELRRRPALRLELALRRLRLPPWYARSSVLGIIGHRRIVDELGGEAAVRVLVRLKKDANPYVRAAAEEAIGKTSKVRFS